MIIGSLFTGYGGLDMSLPGQLAWYSDIEPAAVKLGQIHHPGVPNLGDVTTVDWATVPRVDILTGGYPCQPFSAAGQRKGHNDVRHLWPYVRDAIGNLRPRYVLLENVRGHVTLGLANVIGDLAGMGYDARWGVVRASDALMPHGRARVFILAYPVGTRPQGNDLVSAVEGWGMGHGHHWSGNRPVALSPNAQRGLGGEGTGRGISESAGATRLATRPEWDWGKYSPAVQLWESIHGACPHPTIPGRKPGQEPRLNPVFVEWMMGLPPGHVTGHGLDNRDALKMLGNGVAPPQARLAVSILAGL